VPDSPVYDSRLDTYQHIMEVQGLLLFVVNELVARAHLHDQSKLLPPEKEAFDAISERLSETEYGSEAYRATLREYKPAIDHHQKHNSHHPEFYINGIRGMDLLDLIEMLCDWIAAGRRMKNGGDILKSIEYNQDRFDYSDDLRAILENTARRLPDAVR
jgi:hypothetical protein